MKNELCIKVRGLLGGLSPNSRISRGYCMYKAGSCSVISRVGGGRSYEDLFLVPKIDWIGGPKTECIWLVIVVVEGWIVRCCSVCESG